MLPNYYQTLRASPMASIDDIRKDFLQLAAQCRPDRGGSHEEVKRVNEVWETFRSRKPDSAMTPLALRVRTFHLKLLLACRHFRTALQGILTHK
jgi:hypothetical protein